MRRRLLIGAVLAVEALALVAIVWYVDPVTSPRALAAAWIAAAASSVAALLLLRGTHFGTGAILGAGLVLRLALLPADPTLSDDVWRYLHDGRAQLAGVSPYAFAPADDATLPFRGPEHPLINHPHLVTIYPPAAQMTFALAALAGASLLSWKLLLLAAELGLALAIVALLRARGRDARLVAVYAWHPLAALEIAGNAHLEPIALAPLMLACAFAAGGRRPAAGAALGVSIAAKYWALPLLPFLARQRPLATGAAAAAAVVALYAPYLLAGGPILGSAGTFVRDWVSNPGAFELLLLATGDRGRALFSAATLLTALLAWLWKRGATPEDAAFAFVFATLLLSPVVHPWYVLWLAALLPVTTTAAPIAMAAAWWTLAAPAAYAVLPAYELTGVWQVPAAAVAVQLAPAALLLCAAAFRAATASSRQRAAHPAA
jgi:alpha-1,6-mannosyltransferase